jgi:hypothetical protein
VRENERDDEENPRRSLKAKIRFSIFHPPALRAGARKSAARRA